MDAKEFLDTARDGEEILRLARYVGEQCIGRGHALIIEPHAEDSGLAVMLEDCGFPEETGIRAGALVTFITHPEAEPKIVGTPAYYNE